MSSEQWLKTIDFIQDAYEAGQANNLAAGLAKLAAMAATGAIAEATLRTAFPLIRLGYAVSGRINQWEKWSAFGGWATGETTGKLIDEINDLHLGGRLYDWLHTDDFDRAKLWHLPRDPILLDLDGNGLETTGLKDTDVPQTYFDFDADGVLTRTGWAGQNDGLLVWDRNANGSIDTGAELFGDFTPLPNGALAPNGFAALVALDSNGDGLLDATDPAFAELKLWRDASQDGVSQGGEFITLADAGIIRLNLTPTLKNQRLPNGNTLAREGSLVMQTRLKPYLDQIELVIDDSGLRLDTTTLNQTLAAKKDADPENYLANLLDLDRYANGFLSGTNWSGLADFDSLIETLPQTAGITALLNEFKVRTLTSGDDNAYLADKADIVLFDICNSWRDGEAANKAWRIAA